MANVVTLDEVRRHLRYPAADTADDAALQFFIEAADEAIIKETGESIAQQFVEFHDGGDNSIWLRHVPVLSIQSIQESWGWATFELDYVQSGSPVVSSNYAYSLDDDQNGYITRRVSGNVLNRFFPGTNNIRVVYTAGRNPIPPIIKLAELELIAHWWTGSQQRSAAQTSQYAYGAMDEPSVRGPGSEYTMINSGIPWRIIEMIKAYRAPPIFG